MSKDLHRDSRLWVNRGFLSRSRQWLMALVVGLSVVGLTLLLARPPVSRAATTITVTSTADPGGTCPGATCTLRQAIATAASGDTINFNLPANSTIRLFSDELVINKNLTINGPGANLLTVQRSRFAGTPDFRIFNIQASINVTISGLTINNGKAPFGGGIFNQGTLTISNSTISGNTASSGPGGGIQNDCQFGCPAGVIATMTITNSTISGNTASSQGGGISSGSKSGTTITNSTISGNSAASGGGIWTNVTVTLTNSTISGNSANFGGGINNKSTSGLDTGGSTSARNTIIALNTAASGPDLTDKLTSQGYNLIGNSSGATITPANQTGDQIGVTATQLNLGPLQDNGGPTFTHALLSGSTAIDKGNSSGSTTDQRGFARPVDSPVIANASGGDGADIGAYEVQADQLPGCNTVNLVVNNNNDSGSGSLRDIIANVCAGQTITFDMSKVVSPIFLTTDELVINKSLKINGPGANLLTVRRGLAPGVNFRIFNIASSSVNVSISGLTISNGNPIDNGGGILNGGMLTVTNSTISGNSASNDGGGIFNNGGTLTIANSTISRNSANSGGGLVNNAGTLTIINSTISGNSANNVGGGISNFGTAGTVTITNSTVTGNTGNSAGSSGGGGISNFATLNARNTIIALNTSPIGPDVDGRLTSQGFNFIGNSSGAMISPAQFSDQIGPPLSPIDPLLDQLRDNGGPTLTHALLSGSTAIDRGHSSGSNTDQRGFTRPVGSPPSPNPNGGDGSDIGAFEVQAPVNTPPTITAAPALSRQQGSAATTSTIATVSDSETPAGNLVVTVTSAPAGISVTNLVNTNGAITADVAASCSATVGANTIGLQVTDGGGATATANLTVNVTAATFSINLTAQNFPASGGTGSVNVTAGGSCSWTAQSNASWITVTSGASGTGNGTVGFKVDPNPNTTQRTGTMTIAGQTFTVTQDAAAPLMSNFQFSSTNYTVNEADGFATINVTRTGDTSGTGSVDYETSDLSSRQRTDYTLAAGTLTFAPGDTSKTFRVLIVDDVYIEGDETLNLTLSNPTGGAVLGNPSAAVLTITDNDSISPTTNPLDGARFFVQQHYYDFLSRYPDSGGLDFWTNNITQCGTDQSCINNKRIDVSNAFYYELEFQQTGSYVYRLYRAAFGNNQPFPNPNPDPLHPGEEKKVPLYLPFMKDRARVRGGPQLAQFQLALANAFVLRTEFTNKYAPGLDGPGFVDAVLATIRNDIGMELMSQRQGLIDLFNTGGRGSVMYRLADDNSTNPINNRAFIDAEYNRSFVFTQYAGYLRRNADMPGFLFWLGQVNGAPLRDVPRQHAMVCSFITSAEYQLRFSSVVTHSNAECPR